MGFCTDADNPTLMAYMAEQCPLSCDVYIDCPGDTTSPTAAPTTPTTTLTTTATTTLTTTAGPTRGPIQAPTTTPTTTLRTTGTAGPTRDPMAPTTSEPTLPLNRLAAIRIPAAVSALDATSFEITIGWNAALEVGPVEFVPRFAPLYPFDDGSSERASAENVVYQRPVLLDNSSDVTTITLTFIARRPVPLGV